MSVKPKISLLTMLVLLLISVSVSYGGETVKLKSSDFSGAWKFTADEKKPPPEGQNQLLIFSLEITVKGDAITGKYEYITYNATRIREGVIRGKIEGNKASLSFFNPEYKWEKGRASLSLGSNGLKWRMTEPPQGEHFLPGTAIMKKVISGKNQG